MASVKLFTSIVTIYSNARTRMATRDPVIDTIELLLQRNDVFEQLSVQPTPKRDLIDRLDISCSTVDRALREVESAGLAKCCDDGVTLTPCGRLVVEEFERFDTRLQYRRGDAQAATTDLVATAARRSDLLDLLNQPLDKRDLVDELGWSRSTIDRTMRDLELLGVVEYVSEGFIPTGFGEVLIREYEAFVDRLDGVLAAADLLSVLDPDVELDAAMLAGAEIVTQKPVVPHAPGTYLSELIETADRMSCVTCAHSHPRAMEIIHSLATDGVEMVFVFPTALLEHVRSSHPDRFPQLLELPNYESWVVDETPYGLFLLENTDETRACLLIYSPDNDLKGVITNTSNKAVEWGERVYRSYEDRAESVTTWSVSTT